MTQTGHGNAKVSFSEVVCEGHCGEDSAKESISEAQRQAFVKAMRNQVLERRSVKVLV